MAASVQTERSGVESHGPGSSNFARCCLVFANAAFSFWPRLQKLKKGCVFVLESNKLHLAKAKAAADFVVTAAASRGGHWGGRGEGGGQRCGSGRERKGGEGQEQLDPGAKTFHFSPFCQGGRFLLAAERAGQRTKAEVG